ncbi:MAG: GumC family protein [Microcoleaceae cyanobacterium]
MLHLLCMFIQDSPEDIDFQKYWLILKRHWLPASVVWLAVVAAATWSAFSIEEKYQASGKLRLKKQSTTSALVTEAAEKLGTLEALSLQDTPLDTEAEVVRSAPIVNQTIETLNLSDATGQPIAYEDFVAALGVKAVPGTDILTLSYESKDPQEAHRVVDVLMQIYTENNVRVNRTEAAAAREFISQQLPKTEQELLVAEAALRSFKEGNQIVDLQQEAQLSVSALKQLDVQINDLEAQADRISARIAELQAKLGIPIGEAMARNALNESATVQQARSKLNEVEDQLALARTQFTDQTPEVIALRSQQQALQRLLDERVAAVVGSPVVSRSDLQIGSIEAELARQLVTQQAELEGVSRELGTLNQIRVQQQQRASSLPRLQQTQQELERQVEAAQTAYDILTDRLQQVRIAENQNVGNVQIISPSIISQYPVSTSKKMVLGLGIIVGSFLYVVTAFLLEIMDPSIKTLKEVRQLFSRYTLLGMVPAFQKKMRFVGLNLGPTVSELPVRDQPHSVIGESYNMLQANLNFVSPDRRLKAIVITSSVANEGKSTVSANLAAAMAQLGSRVLLIDADLRHPRQHHLWDLMNQINPQGLSDVIAGQVEWEKVVRTVFPNLDVLPSGAIPPNSIALLGSRRMNSLIKEFKSVYDFIIFDTPALLLFADALTLGKSSDGVMLVTRPGTIDTASATAARDLLTKSGQVVLGLVANGVKVDHEPQSYFHHAKFYTTKRSLEGGSDRLRYPLSH